MASTVSSVLHELRAAMLEQFSREGYGEKAIDFLASADLRFRGQTSEIRVDLAECAVTSQAVAEDVRNEKVSRKAAREEYGVALVDGFFEVDTGQTKKLRSYMRTS